MLAACAAAAKMGALRVTVVLGLLSLIHVLSQLPKALASAGTGFAVVACLSINAACVAISLRPPATERQ
jgi:hypothetical protein